MNSARIWTERLKTFSWYGALMFPFFWLVIGGMLRTPLLLASGLLGIYGLRQARLLPRLLSYGSWVLPMMILTVMGLIRHGSESEVINPIWFVLVLFYALPAGILVAHGAGNSRAVLNWVCTFVMLGFGLWSFLVMQQVDLSEVVRLTNDVATRLDQKYSVDLFGVFSWDNVKMAIIPWCAYPLAAIVAVACRGPMLGRVVLLVAGAIGAYVAGAFLTRTVFFASGIAIVAILPIYLIKANSKTLLLSLAIFFILAIAVAATIHSVPVINEYVNGLMDRFSYTSDDSRQYLWADATKLILARPTGGGDALLEDHLWAHNLPLDMGLLYGFPGIAATLWMICMLLVAVTRWALRLRGSVDVFDVTFLSVFIAALVSCMISPPDLAFITPLVFIGVFARERARMLPSRVPRVRVIVNSPLPAPNAATGAHV